MKKSASLLTGIILFYSVILAQSPLSIPYQAVVRDGSGNLVTNQLVSFRFTIHDVSASGTTVYQETQSGSLVATNNLGLVTVNVGAGTPVGTYTFSSIVWGTNAKFMTVEIDPAGGTSYVNMGTTQLLSVPYALYAANAGNASSGGTPTPSGVIVMYSGAWNFDATGLGTGSLAGYALCNGNNGTPNLTEQFIMGAASSSELSTTGGATTHTHSVPAISIPALSIPAEAVTGTIPALTVPSLAISGTIPAIGVTGSIPGLSVPGLSIPGLSVPGLSVPALTIPSLAVTGTIQALPVTATIPALDVTLGGQVVACAGSTTTSLVNSTAGYMGLGAGNAWEYYGGATPRVLSTGNGSVAASYTALQIQSSTVQSTASAVTSGTTTAATITAGDIKTTASSTGTGTTGTGTTGTGTTGTGTTGTGTLGSGTTVSYSLAAGNISTTASTTTAYTLGSGSLSTAATSTGTGTTTATTSGSASSLPPYFKLAFIMKQ